MCRDLWHSTFLEETVPNRKTLEKVTSQMDLSDSIGIKDATTGKKKLNQR
jgi:hypothetical protein